MNAYHYTPKYRPPMFHNLPSGAELVERGTAGHFPLRKDLPEGATKHGVVRYRRPLTEHEIELFELEPA